MLGEDEILARELGRLGGIGARLVARLLTTNVGEREVTVLARQDHVHAVIRQVFRASIEDEPTNRVIRVRVVAGKMNLNPALITFFLGSGLENETTVRVRGAAKEGWVKQRAGEQAANRAAEWLGTIFEIGPQPPGAQRTA